MGFAQQLAELVGESSFSDLPTAAVEISKDMMVNAAAVGLAGAAQTGGLAITRFAQEMGGNGKCTIIGMGLRTSPMYAALANGAMVRLLDFDDGWSSKTAHWFGSLKKVSGCECGDIMSSGCPARKQRLPSSAGF